MEHFPSVLLRKKWFGSNLFPISGHSLLGHFLLSIAGSSSVLTVASTALTLYPLPSSVSVIRKWNTIGNLAGEIHHVQQFFALRDSSHPPFPLSSAISTTSSYCANQKHTFIFQNGPWRNHTTLIVWEFLCCLEGMATHSDILAWRIPWTEEPGGLQSIGSQRVRHDWVTNTLPLILSYLAQNLSSALIHCWLAILTWMIQKNFNLLPKAEPVISHFSKSYFPPEIPSLLAACNQSQQPRYQLSLLPLIQIPQLLTK